MIKWMIKMQINKLNTRPKTAKNWFNKKAKQTLKLEVCSEPVLVCL
jgi:hypothetical protein